MAVRALTEDEVDACRAIRLEALASDPSAFGSTHALESTFGEDVWRARLTGGDDRRNVILVDEIDGEIVGTAGVTMVTSDPVPLLVGMWVRSSARRRGVARRLVESAVTWTRDQGFGELLLWVVSDNSAAIALYEDCGFVATGNVATMPSDRSIVEQEMRCSLR